MTKLKFIVAYVMFMVGTVFGDILHVPDEYATIQLSLSSISQGDTILIAPGTYEESLTAPPLDFVMMGEFRLDSQATQFSVIDPTNIPGSDTLQVLRLTGGNASFFDLIFRNGTEMIEGRLQSTPGGILGNASVHSLRFERCVFDSVVAAISTADTINVTHCRFIGCLGAVYTGFWRGRLNADSTWFDGTGGLVNTQEGCSIENCSFTHRGPGPIITGVGDSLRIKHCRFIGSDLLTGHGLRLRGRCGSLVTGCQFEGIVVQGSVIDILDSCSQSPECAIKITNNRFLRCGGPSGIPSSGGVMIRLTCNNAETGYVATLLDNRIDSTQVIYGHASGVEVNASCRIERTSFGDHLGANKPQVYFEGRGPADSLVILNNSFSRLYYGLEYGGFGGSFVDARGNWWGDSSGPYNETQNPDGQGAQVDDQVLFDPWLIVDPDSNSTNSTTHKYSDAIPPSSFGMEVFPNPFNSTLSISLEVPAYSNVTLALYDLLGREVDVVYRGRLSSQKISYVAPAALASGIYFLMASSGARSSLVKVVLLK